MHVASANDIRERKPIGSVYFGFRFMTQTLWLYSGNLVTRPMHIIVVLMGFVLVSYYKESVRCVHALLKLGVTPAPLPIITPIST